MHSLHNHTAALDAAKAVQWSRLSQPRWWQKRWLILQSPDSSKSARNDKHLAMSRYVSVYWLCLLLGGMVGISTRAQAQLFSYTRGEAYSSQQSEFTAAYKVEYRQALYKNFSASFDYLNEGHFTGHHRDGYALEAWYKVPLFAKRRIVLSAGVGPYYYFDTITPPGGTSTDAHGLAPIISMNLRGELWKHWDWVVSADSMNPTHDFKSTQLGIGIGYWMSPDRNSPGIFEFNSSESAKERNELSLFGVLSVINISGNPNSWGGSAEYRYRFARHIDGTVAYIYEGDPRVARRSGVTAQVWPVRTDVRSGIEVGAGFGAYVFVDTKHQPIPGQVTSAAIAPMVSIMLSYPAHANYFARFIWDRVVSNYSRDADIWRLGIGHNL